MSIDGIKYKKSKIDGHKEILIVPISDTHIGADFNECALRKTFNFVKENPNAFLIFNGDLINVGLPDSVDDEWHEQEPLSPQDQLELFIHILGDYDVEDRILGIIGGSNHHARARKRIMHDYDLELAQRLGMEDLYSPNAMILKLDVGWDSHISQSVFYFLYATHGWSAGRKPGAPVNAALDLALSFPMTDCYIISHCHLQSCHVDNFMVPSMRANKLVPFERHYITSGSYLNWGGYAQRKGMRMLGVGSPLIRLCCDYRKVKVEL